MLALLVLADDLTGALDTGIQFAKLGISTEVCPEAQFNFDEIDKNTQVAVVNTTSRHLMPQEAYAVVYDIVKKAYAMGVRYFYKKTDSALRGNVGSELLAVLHATGQPLYFIPAYPKMGRTTKNGVHWIDGVPVAESVFGKDPFSPVQSSNVAEILDANAAEQVSAQLQIYDAETQVDLAGIAAALKCKQATVFAGCAGFAAYLPQIIQFSKNSIALQEKKKGLIVVTGSVNAVTLRQMDYAAENGFSQMVVPAGKEEPQFEETPIFSECIRNAGQMYRQKNRLLIRSIYTDEAQQVMQSPDIVQKRQHVANSMGGLAATLMRQIQASFFIIGGDVLLACMKHLQAVSLVPLEEPIPGVVYAKVYANGRVLDLYTKSGGFGEESVVLELEARIDKEGKNHEAK